MLRKDYAHQKKLQIKIESQQKELGILNSLLPKVCWEKKGDVEEPGGGIAATGRRDRRMIVMVSRRDLAHLAFLFFRAKEAN